MDAGHFARGHTLHQSLRPRIAATLILATMLSPASGPHVLPGQGAAPRRMSEPAERTRAIARHLVETASLPGLSVAISRNGQVVFAEGFGYADIERRAPVTAATRFRTGSVGKVITATALGRLLQDGRIDLDAPVQRYVPGYPVQQWPITARDLAGHVSGMAHYGPGDRLAARFYPTVSDALSVFSHQPLREAPRTAYRYSTHGYTLLSAVIEGAAGQPFLDYLREAVTAPLGMTGTGPDLRATPDTALATFYRWTNDALARVTAPEDPSYKWAGGGLVSTPRDLLRLADAYRNGFLDAKTVDALWTSQTLIDGRRTGVGLGWRSGPDMAGRRVIEHAGSMEGTRAVLSIFPDEQVAVAVMTNREWPSRIEETAHLLALPFMAPPPQRAMPAASRPVTVERRSDAGVKTTEDGTLELRDDRGTLVIAPGTTRNVSYPLVRVTDEVYAMVAADGVYHLTLRANADGLVGTAIAYGSPRLASPATTPPFLTFTASR